MEQQSPSTQPTPSKTPHPPVSGPLAGLESWLYDMLVVKAPFQLPKSFTDWLVKYGPWVTLVIAVLLLPLVFTVIGLSTFVGGLAGSYGVAVGPTYWLALLALVAQIAVMFISVPMLLKQQRKGWQLLFYAELFNIAYVIVNGFGSSYTVVSSLVSAAVSAVIGFYILFQIRHYYTK